MEKPNLLRILFFQESRKVAFGVYLFIVANVYLGIKLITSGDWMTCIALASCLVGGGTVADRFLESRTPKKPDEPK